MKKRIHLVSSPNIAFIKYWGKKDSLTDNDKNIPLNPSLSLTLSKAQSEIILEESNEFQFTIQDKAATPKDSDKIRQHIERIENAIDIKLSPFHLMSSNNFPTGTGIASSASAFSGLTCAFLAWAKGKDFVENQIKENPCWIADLARRGSGSACRSLHGPFVKWWEKTIQTIPSAWKLYDTILIFSKTEKKVSSTEGHKFAPLSPLFAKRLEKLPHRLHQIETAIQDKKLSQLGPILEEEADDMHQIMRENPHPVEYQLPESKKFLNALKEMKSRNFYYTLDAGPNVHLISESPILDQVNEMLLKLNLKAEIWEDQTGLGPRFLS